MTDTTAREKSGKRLNGRRLVFLAMLFASFALSLGSFWQTMNGMAGFTARDVMGWMVSIIITTGVQLLLFAISWRIAESWREGGGQLLGNLVIWTICGFVSMFFSFYGFFNDQGGRDEFRNVLTVQSEAAKVLGEIATSQDTARDGLKEDIIGANGELRDIYVKWKNDEIIGAITAASDAKETIARGAEDRKAALRDAKTRENDRLIEVQRNLDNLQIEIDRLEQQRTARIESIENLDKKIAETESRIDDARTNVNSLQVRLESEGRTGRGPRYREIELDLNTAQATLDAEIAKLSDQRNERTTALAGQEEEAKGELLDEYKRQQAELVADREVFKANIAEISIDQAEQDRGIQLAPDEKRAEADALLLEFESGRLSVYATIVGNCQELLRTLNANDVKERVQGIDCTSPELRAAIANVDEIEAQVATFNDTCRSEQLFRLEKVSNIIDTAIQCVGTLEGAAAGDVAKHSTELANLKATRGENANLISQARVALFDDLQANAFMAVVLAFSVDILVLLCAWVGRNVGLSEWARALDRFVMLTKQSPDPETFEYVAETPKSGREREQFLEVVGWLLREGLAEWNVGNQTRINLRPGAMQRIRSARAAEMSEDGPNETAPPRTATLVQESAAPNVLDYGSRFGTRKR